MNEVKTVAAVTFKFILGYKIGKCFAEAVFEAGMMLVKATGRASEKYMNEHISDLDANGQKVIRKLRKTFGYEVPEEIEMRKIGFR